MADPCPGAQILEMLALEGDQTGAARIHAEHVANCDVCRRTIDEIRENERFLRRNASGLAASGPAVVPIKDRGPATVPKVRGFELSEEVGRGGQGVVYRAVQTSTKRPAAVKLLIDGAFASERQFQRFAREIELASRLRHPGIVSVYDSGETTNGSRYVAMEFVQGDRIDQYVRETFGGVPLHARARLEGIVRLAVRVCAAIGHAHELGIVHRDLKPSNILVDSDGNPRVLDFGLARGLDDSAMVSMTREFVGTPAYAAPEQLMGDGGAVGTRADVYALGVILYGLIADRHPYPIDGSMADLVRNATTAAPIPLSHVVPRIPADIETIVLKCLSKEPSRRYATAAALANDLEDYLAARPISARRDSTAYVLRKLAHRNRVPVIAGGALLLTILAATIVLGFFAAKLDKSLAESTVQRARLVAREGDAEVAERLLWAEASRANFVAKEGALMRGSARQRRSAWALAELYSRLPRVFRARNGSDRCHIMNGGDGATVSAISDTGVERDWSLNGSLLRESGVSRRSRKFIGGAGGFRAFREDDRVSIFDSITGEVVAGPVPQDGLSAQCVSEDGSMIALGSTLADRRVRLVNMRTFETVAEFDEAQSWVMACRWRNSPAFLIAPYPGGPHFVTIRSGAGWPIVKRWDLTPIIAPDPRRSVHAWLAPGEGYLLVVYGPNVFMVDASGTVVSVAESSAEVSTAAFNGSATQVTTASQDGSVVTWTVPGLKRVGTILNGVNTCSVLPDGDAGLIACGDTSGRVSVYETGDRPWLGRIPRSYVTAATVACGSEGAVAWGDDEGTLSIRAGADDAVIKIPNAHRMRIQSVAFSVDGGRLLTAGADGAARMWGIDGTLLSQPILATEELSAAAFGRAGTGGAAVGNNGMIHRWPEGNVGPKFDVEVECDRFSAMAFSVDNSRLIAATRNKGTFVMDSATGAELMKLGNGRFAERAVACSPDGKQIAIGSDDRAVRFYDSATGRLEREVGGLPWAIYDLEFDPTGTVLFAVGRGPEIVVIDSSEGTELAKFTAHEKHIFSIAVSADGRTLYTAGQDPYIGVTDLGRLERYVIANARYATSADAGLLDENTE